MTTKRKATKATKETPNFQSYVKVMWLSMFALLFFMAATFVLITKTQLPDTKELEVPKYEIASQIISADNKELGKAFKYNREWIQFNDINPHVVEALVATEDERYWNHSGIDAKGTLRAFVYLGKKGGASTITQQLAKLFFTQRSSSIVKRSWQKLKEWIIATEFEKRYTKEEILAMYLNKYDYLYGAVGIGSAAKTYFGKDQKTLTIDEAAILIGMLKNPYMYNPKIKVDGAFKRRNVVMNQMVKNDYLKRSDYDSLKILPIDISNFQRPTHFTGPAPYFRAELVKWLKDLLEEDKYRKPDGTKYNLYTDGLKVYTTIDMGMQVHAEKAMVEHMSALQEKLFSRWEGKDPWTYDADANQKSIRSSALNNQIAQSERYKELRATALSSIIAKISGKFPDARIWDADMWRMLSEKDKPGHLANLVKAGTISKDQASTYKEIMKSEHWVELGKQWKSFRSNVKKIFNKKIKMQVFAYNNTGEKTVEMSPLDSIKYHRMHLQIGSMAIDPQTGYVRTWVGGIGYKYFQYDHIQQSNRQIGSTFKPFIYTTAIADYGMSPCLKVEDRQYSIAAKDANFELLKAWSPSNADGKFTGEYLTLKEGLKQSKNSISVYLMKEIGNVERVRDLVSNLGIDKNKIPSAPSICLGTPDLSVMDMAGAYTAFANNGVHTKPIFVTKIEDKEGRVIYSAVPESHRVINEVYNYVMVDMLKYAGKTIAHNFKSEIGGKTGTTNDYVDGWFMGITPELVVGTWVGGEDQWVRFRNLQDGQGGVMARPFFVSFLERVENDKTIDYDVNSRFNVPTGEIIELDCSKYAALEAQDQSKKPKGQDEFEEEF